MGVQTIKVNVKTRRDSPQRVRAKADDRLLETS
jgi:hypothetical protein